MKIPLWMLQPEAARFHLCEQVKLSPSALSRALISHYSEASHVKFDPKGVKIHTGGGRYQDFGEPLY